MKRNKKFRLKQNEIKNIVPGMGYCIATDKITVDGLCVGYMYREKPDNVNDSGWRFFEGTETQDYVNNDSNMDIYDVNTIANYDNSIIPYLNMPIGTELLKEKCSRKFLPVSKD